MQLWATLWAAGEFRPCVRKDDSDPVALVVSLMSYNVPLDLIAEQIGIHHNTALLMRRKLFETVNGWQEKVRLSGTVFIDEVYTFDSDMPKNHYGRNQRGLSKSKRCIFIAIDQYKNMVAFLVGSGMPTSKRINDALLPHLANGNVTKVVHDGLQAHRRAIKSAGVEDEIHKSIVGDEETLRAMALVNSFSSWVKRYLSRFTGMDTSYQLPARLPKLVCIPVRVQEAERDLAKG